MTWSATTLDYTHVEKCGACVYSNWFPGYKKSTWRSRKGCFKQFEIPGAVGNAIEAHYYPNKRNLYAQTCIPIFCTEVITTSSLGTTLNSAECAWQG
eukprot:g14132.t1